MKEEFCRKVVGYDVNALYVKCSGLEMPTGFYIDYTLIATDWFRPSFPNNQSVGALEWLTHIAISQGINIQHRGNSNEVVWEWRNVTLMDGAKKHEQPLNTMVVITMDMTASPRERIFHLLLNSRKELKKQKAKHAYIRDVLGITLEVMQECAWKQEHKAVNM